MATAREFELRPATANDADVLARHRIGMFRDMGSLAVDQEAPLREASRAYFARAIPSGEYVSWVATPRGEPQHVVGGAGAQIRPMLPRHGSRGGSIVLGPEAIIVNMYVDREWRRHGIARALMQAILEWAPAAGVQRLVLHASSEGRPLYESLGFKATNEMLYGGSLVRR